MRQATQLLCTSSEHGQLPALSCEHALPASNDVLLQQAAKLVLDLILMKWLVPALICRCSIQKVTFLLLLTMSAPH